MTRAVAIAILLGAVIVLIMLIQRAPQPNLPLVEATMPINAPALATPCNIPPPGPPPEREA